MCETNSRRIEYGKMLGGKDPNSDLAVELHHDQAPAQDASRVREFLAKKPITKPDHPPDSLVSVPRDFLAVSKIKKRPERTKTCCHS
jgi:hypothetical protein